MSYQVPEGWADTPYIFVFDGTTLTDGSSYRRLSVPMDGDFDFRLRRVAGLSTVAQSINLMNGSGQPISSRPYRGRNSFVLAPELPYVSSGEIVFDLNTVSRDLNACATPIYTSYLAFQGVKRRRATGESAFPGAPIPYTYSQEVTVNWYRYVSLPAAAIEPPRVFYVTVDDYDFVLQNIKIADAASGSALTGTVIQIRLYDDRGRALSSAPLNQQFVNAGLTGWGSGFPVPGVTYRRGSVLRFDVTSMICNTDPTFPRDLRINFEGVRRLPT